MALRDVFSTGLAGPQIWALADALDAVLAGPSEALAAFLEVPDLASDDLPAWALDVLGSVLNLGRQAGWSDADYLLALRAQAVARRSAGTLPDLWELAELVTPITEGISIQGGPCDVSAFLPGVSDLSAARQRIIGDAFIRAIDAIAGLKITSAPATLAGKIFRLDDPLRGLDRGLLANTIYAAP